MYRLNCNTHIYNPHAQKNTPQYFYPYFKLRVHNEGKYFVFDPIKRKVFILNDIFFDINYKQKKRGH